MNETPKDTLHYLIRAMSLVLGAKDIRAIHKKMWQLRHIDTLKAAV